MNIDEQIKQALNDEINDLKSDHDRIDANPFKQMQASLKGQMGWMYVLVMTITLLFFVGMLYSAYQFYLAEEIKPLLGWAVGIMIFAMFTQVSKMLYWTEMGHNRVIREVKVLELQLAQLTEKVSGRD